MTAIAGPRAGTPLALPDRVSLVRPLTLLPIALIPAIALPAAPSPAAAQPLWQAEVHAAYGLALSGGGDTMSRRPTPLTFTALAAFAFDEDPPLAGYGGLVIETLDRNAAGAAFGVELWPRDSRFHLAGGGVAIVAPYTLLGATASGGVCMRAGRGIGLCGDLQLTAFVAGSDLADGRTVTQAQLVAGLVFDAL